jgi:hypothetical protein
MPTLQKYKSQHYYGFLLAFVALKLLLNLLASPHFGFHRDELLHLALGDHLDWGYKEVPPLIGFLAKLSTALFGKSVMAARIFPTIAAGLIVWFTGLIAVELGGGRFAIALTCLSLIFAPAFAASGYLFQPVVFDQLWWVISAWLTVKYVNKEQKSYLYGLGVIAGLGMLTKYSMAFFAFALLLSVLATPQRKLLFNKATLVALGIAALIFLPNILWQYLHHWPVITHMHKLKAQQLDYVKPADFILQQFLVNGLAGLIWIVGLTAVLFSKHLKPYRFMGLAYLLVFIFLLKMNGKAYYLFGAYPMLFAAGGSTLAYLTGKRRIILRAALLSLLALPNLLLLPMVLPLLPIKQTKNFFGYIQQHLHFLNFATTWEDQKQHPITQDYADMFGWEEMAQKTAAAYHRLTPDQQRRTIIFTDNYGEAAAIHQYHEKYKMPDVVSLNSSFALWAPANLKADNMLYISDDNDVSDLVPLSGKIIRVAGIEDKTAREYGTGIFFVSDIKPGLRQVYHVHWAEEASQ